MLRSRALLKENREPGAFCVWEEDRDKDCEGTLGPDLYLRKMGSTRHSHMLLGGSQKLTQTAGRAMHESLLGDSADPTVIGELLA